jgi:hypothetical protein
MTNYIMECNHTEELESAMYNSEVFPLVAELHKKFNLYVIQQIYMKDQGCEYERTCVGPCLGTP